MLLIVVVLVVFLANTCVLGTFPQIDTSTASMLNLTEVNSTFTKLNGDWMYKLIWDENITRDALQEAIQQYSTTADFKIRGKKAFIKSLRNDTTMAQKVEEALVYPFMRAQKFLRLLPWYTYYGCNGVYNTKSGQDVLTAVCLYREKI
ncbi:hypothetical protein GCK32_017188 [Trichostrongylus colubriformis]|uniref:Uncharacterized protein n=1 Tax=Trichostrongylus colubriformis TaxID=6319 RepID=A0AAN8G5Z6_TRICO